jgi:hypothetical protein
MADTMPHSSTLRRAACAGLGLATILLVACKMTAATEAAAVAANVLTIVQGNFQAAQAGLALPTAIVLRVTDATGTGGANAPVTLVVADGGGAVDPASGKTDAKGEIKAKWTLGPSSAGQSLLANTPGADAVKLQAFGILPSDIIIAQGNNQTARVTAVVPNTIVVRVVGPGNVPMVGVTVGFVITGGGGAITPQSAITSNLGEATAKWTLGPMPGTNVAIVTTSTLTPAVLTATAIP